MNNKTRHLHYLDSVTRQMKLSQDQKIVVSIDKNKVPIYVRLVELKDKGPTTASYKTEKGKRVLTIPVEKDRISVLSSPVELAVTGRRKYLLGASTSPKKSILGRQPVSISVYEEGEDLSSLGDPVLVGIK